MRFRSISGAVLCLRAACMLSAVAFAPIAHSQQLSKVVYEQPEATAPATGQNRACCSLTGRVTTSNGEALSDATVQVSGPLAVIRSATTDGDGQFAISDLPLGTFTVSVSLDGFTPVSGSIRLAPGTSAATTTFALRPAESASVTVSASAKDIAEAQIELAEQQRVAGLLPNFFVSYVWQADSLTTGQKFRLATKTALDPGNLLLVGTVAGVQQARDSFPGYGQGWQGYGRRYGADLGNLVAGTYMSGAVLPSIFHQDPRYFYKGNGSTSSRFWYAISRVVVTRGDNGRSQPNYSTVLGDMSAGAISNLYYAPVDRRSAKVTVANGLLGLAGDAMNNVFQEFFLKRLTTNSKRNSLEP